MSKEIIHAFVKAINTGDIFKMYSLMSEDHTFIDAHGNKVTGRDEMKAGWKGYFEMFPDYKIEINEIFENDDTIAAMGYAGGTYHGLKTGGNENAWRLPVSWKAIVDEGKIKLWQVFADTKIPFEIIARNSLQKPAPKTKGQKRVTSIGGIFFKCSDPEKVKEWYKKHLGLDIDQYGTAFEWRHADNPGVKGFSQWSPFKDSTKYFEPSQKDFMINYRVEDLTWLVEQLKKEGVTVTDSIESFEYGKFVHIMDEEGNKIELWEADDIEFEKVITGRTK